MLRQMSLCNYKIKIDNFTAQLLYKYWFWVFLYGQQQIFRSASHGKIKSILMFLKNESYMQNVICSVVLDSCDLEIKHHTLNSIELLFINSIFAKNCSLLFKVCSKSISLHYVMNTNSCKTVGIFESALKHIRIEPALLWSKMLQYQNLKKLIQKERFKQLFNFYK